MEEIIKLIDSKTITIKDIEAYLETQGLTVVNTEALDHALSSREP